MKRNSRDFKDRFRRWKNGEQVYDGGRIKEVIVTPDNQYNQFLNTLPDNQKYTPEYEYRTHRYWELNDKPKDFAEGKRGGPQGGKDQ